MALLSLEGVETAYGDSQVLFGLNLDVAPGQVATLLGRNGMGKTTTVRSIMSLTPIRAGAIRFEGKPIHGLAPYEIAQAGIGLVPEGRQIFPNLSVRENLVATAADRRSAPKPWTAERVFELFPPLAQRRTSLGGLLSGGEQQMLAVGRALVLNPRLLLLDEPLEGLAPIIVEQMANSIRALKSEGLSVILCEQNLHFALGVADRAYIIEKGQIRFGGSMAELAADASLREQYLSV